MTTACRPSRLDLLVSSLVHAGRFSCSPRYSLFGCDSRGEYTLILATGDARQAAVRYLDECFAPDDRRHLGLELRCDGVRVSI